MTNSSAASSISDDAVQAKTGRRWDEWFALLDAAGAAAMSHRQIVEHIAAHHPISNWWQQSVTVAYEKARGLRVKHQQADGFQVSTSRTVGVSVDALFDAFADPAARERWLPGEPIEIRRATRPRSLRITWSDGRTHVDVDLYAKGDAKSQLSLGHRKLESAAEAERMKAYWAAALDRLREALLRP